MWASEVFLENLVAHGGRDHDEGGSDLVVEGHRPWVLVGEQAANSDALSGIMGHSTLMRAVPLLENASGFFDYEDVDVVAEDVAASSVTIAAKDLQGRSDDRTRFSVKNHPSGAKVSVGACGTHMSQAPGVAFKELEIMEWLAQAANRGLHPLVTTYQRMWRSWLRQGRIIIIFPYLSR